MKQKRILALLLALVVTISGICWDVPRVYAEPSEGGLTGYVLTEAQYQEYRDKQELDWWGLQSELASVTADTLEELLVALAEASGSGYYVITPTDESYTQNSALNIPASVAVTSGGAINGVVLQGNFKAPGIKVASNTEATLFGGSFENPAGTGAGNTFVLSGGGTVVFKGTERVTVNNLLCGDAASEALQVKFKGYDALLSKGLDTTKWGSVTFEQWVEEGNGITPEITVDGAVKFGSVNAETDVKIFVKYDADNLPTFTQAPGTFAKLDGEETLSGKREADLTFRYVTEINLEEKWNSPIANVDLATQQLVNYSGVNGALWACKLWCDGGDVYWGYIDENGYWNSGTDEGICLAYFADEQHIEDYRISIINEDGEDTYVNDYDPDIMGYFRTMEGAVAAMKQDAAAGGSGYYWMWIGKNEISAPAAVDLTDAAGIRGLGVGILAECTDKENDIWEPYSFAGFSSVKLGDSQTLYLSSVFSNKISSVTGGKLCMTMWAQASIGTVDVKELEMRNKCWTTIGTLKANKLSFTKEYSHNPVVYIVDKLDVGMVEINSPSVPGQGEQWESSSRIVLFKNSTARFGGITGWNLQVCVENDAAGKLPQITIDGDIETDDGVNFRIYNWTDLEQDAALDRYDMDNYPPIWEKIDSTFNYAMESDIAGNVLFTVTEGHTILDKGVDIFLGNQPGDGDDANLKWVTYETDGVRRVSVSGGTAVYGNWGLFKWGAIEGESGFLSKYVLIKSATTPGGSSGGGSGSGGGSSSGGSSSSGGGSESGSTGGTTTETKPDGTKVETTTETTTDGTKVETVVETKPDGTTTESVTETSADGSKTETVTETAADGTKTESVTETKTDGSKTESVTETKPDGTKTETVNETKADGSKSESVTETKPDGSVSESKTETAADGSSTETVKETAADGSSVENIVEKNQSGEVVKTTETVTETDGSATKTEKESTTNMLGTDVAVTLTTKTDSAGSVTSVTKTSEMVDSASGVSIVVTVNMDGNGKTKRTRASITLTIGGAKKAPLKGAATPVADVLAARKLAAGIPATISKDMLVQIIEAAGTDDVAITLTVADEEGNVKYKLKVNSETLTAGNKLYIYKLNTKTGKYTMVNAKTYKVGGEGDVTVSMSEKATYELVDAAKAKEIDKAIKASIAPKLEGKTLKAGKTVSFKLDSGANKNSIKSIKYTSNKPSVAAVDKDGKITAKGKGTATVKAKVTLKNGKVKTVKMKISVI